MSTGISEVKLMTPKEFQSLLQSSERSNYQLVDVREENELQVAKFDGTDIINLPLSQIEQIGQEIKQGKLLDLNKPTICICRRGARAGRFATFLGTLSFSSFVYISLIFLFNSFRGSISKCHQSSRRDRSLCERSG